MAGTLRMMLAIAVLIVAGYGIYYLWTGSIPAHAMQVLGTYAIITAIVFVITLITKPAGEKH
ncbi:MAG: hypothetical protein AAF996_12595 [Pseudomonadota bacterium]